MANKYYLNWKTRTIHIVGWGMTKPRSDGFTNCGCTLFVLIRCTRSLSRVAPFKICKRCKQLTGD